MTAHTRQPATLFVIEHSPGPAWEDGTDFREQPGIQAHFAFMSLLDPRGLLVMGDRSRTRRAIDPLGWPS